MDPSVDPLTQPPPGAHDDAAADAPDAPRRPGPIYDTAMRHVVDADPAAACAVFGVPVTGEQITQLRQAFPAATLAADLVLAIGPAPPPTGTTPPITGRPRLAHVEYMRTGAADLVSRMLVYRGLIMRANPTATLSQHVVILGDGRVTGHDDLHANGFALDLTVIHLRDQPPQRFLLSPGLAPLAVLGKGDAASRARVLLAAYQVIRDTGDPERVGRLLEAATVLATVRLDVHTIGEIVREAGMTVESIVELFEGTEWGRTLGAVRRQEGRQEGQEAVLHALLRERFGPESEVGPTAQRLARWPDVAAAVAAINSAESLQDIPQLS